jgi:hypothetical protein
MSNTNVNDDLEVFEQARPYIRSVLAFLVLLRFGEFPTRPNTPYEVADTFLDRLRTDIQEGGKAK